MVENVPSTKDKDISPLLFVSFALGGAASMALLYTAMCMYGDYGASRDVIEKTAWYFVVIAGLGACYALFRRRS